MRYIGNKTRLLPFLLGAVERIGVAPGSAHDAFAGTAAVGRALKASGWRVASSDIMTYSYVFQRAYVVSQRVPSFAALRAGDADVRRALRSPHFARAAAEHGGGALAQVAEYLSGWLEPESGFITMHFSPLGGRMYFTEENARRVDAIRCTLERWRTGGLIGEDAFFLLLAALLEAADRVANTAGVYAAYIKQWQPNALRPLRLDPAVPARGAPGCSAQLADSATAAESLGAVDLLYVDPPYNARQYSGYYHVPEIIARGWFGERPTLSGTTGLPAGGSPRSDWCSPRRVRGALEALLSATGARHVLVSYNSEGLLAEEVLHEALAAVAVGGRVRRHRHRYRRYRADSDHARRSYRADIVSELLYHAEIRRPSRSSP